MTIGKLQQCLQFGTRLVFSGTFILFSAIVSPIGEKPVTASTIPDTTLGTENSTVLFDTNFRGQLTDLIRGGAIRDANLFHSFLQFNVLAGKNVYFDPPPEIQNIFTRVTGLHPSHIHGNLGVNGGANLYLMNPHGILFGANARLDIPGSFVATTAESLVFANGDRYSAIAPQPPSLLTMNVPPGLQYGASSGAIHNRGRLNVGGNLFFGARHLDLQGELKSDGDLTLFALDGIRMRDRPDRPFIVSAGGDLMVQGGNAIDISTLKHPDSVLSSGGNMLLQSAFSVRGDARFRSGGYFAIADWHGNLGILESWHSTSIQAGGDVLLDSYYGSSLEIFAGGSVLIPGTVVIWKVGTDLSPKSATLSNGTTQTIQGNLVPTLHVQAGMQGLGAVDGITQGDVRIGEIVIFNWVRGNGGNIFVTNQVQSNETLVGNITLGEIDGWDILQGSTIAIDSRNDIILAGETNISAEGGNAGGLKLLAGGNISANADIFATGTRGGDILIESDGNIAFNGANIDFSGDGGQFRAIAQNDVRFRNTRLRSHNGNGTIAIAAERLNLEDGTLETSGEIHLQGGTFRAIDSQVGSSNGGQITIAARDLTVLDNSRIYSHVPASAWGTGGKIALTSPIIHLNRAAIESLHRGGGTGGEIRIHAMQELRLEESGIFSTTESTGGGGDVRILANSLILQNNAAAIAQTRGSGNSGKVEAIARDIFLNNSSQMGSIVASGATGHSGGLAIATDTLTLDNNSQLTARTEGYGNAGNLSLDIKNWFSLQGSQIFANTSTQGQGGEININSVDLDLLNSLISASSQGSGNAGEITIALSGNLQAVNSAIAASTQHSEGGNIDISAVEIALFDTDITTAVERGTGKGGDITLTAHSILAFGDTNFISSSPQGLGGNITFNSPVFFGESFAFLYGLDFNPFVNIISGGLINGIADLPDTRSVGNNLTELPADPLDRDRLIANSCIVQTQPETSSLTRGGRGGLYQAPGDLSAPALPTGTLRPLSEHSEAIAAVTGIFQLPDGSIVIGRECNYLEAWKVEGESIPQPSTLKSVVKHLQALIV